MNRSSLIFAVKIATLWVLVILTAVDVVSAVAVTGLVTILLVTGRKLSKRFK